MKKFTIVFYIGLGAVLLLVISGCQAISGPKGIKIAIAVPLTGDVASMGQGMRNGALLAVEEANQKYKAQGLTFELVQFDDRADPKEAVNIANQIISDSHIYGIIGHLNSGCSIPAASVYARKNVVMISPASTNPKLTQLGLANVFRLCTTDEVQGSFAAKQLLKDKIKKVAIIHDKTPYGQGLAEEFKKTFEAGGGSVAIFEGISIGDKDFKALLIKIKTLSPEAIYFGGMYQEGGLLSKQAKELKLSVPVVGGDGIYSNDFIKIAGAVCEGDLATTIGLPLAKLPKGSEFIAKYQKKFPNIDMQPYDPATYDATNLLIEAVVASNKDKAKILEYIKKANYEGVTGKVQFDTKGDTLNKAVSMYVVKQGKWVDKD